MDGPEVLRDLRARQADLEDAERRRGEAITARDDAITRARRAGISAAEISVVLGVSRTVVHRAISRHP